jgi:hypothetical protein
MDRSKQWIVSVAVAAAAAALVATAVLLGGGDDSCEEWQERYEAALESMGAEPGMTGSLQFINMGPLAGLEESRPEGCATPG